jgi:hypothetical protein
VTRILTALTLLLVIGIAACGGDVDHASLDKWMQTERGPGKLRKALADGSLDPDLSAHAAENLMIIREDAGVVEAFERMEPARRSLVLARLAPRLWALARIEGELTAPSDQQVAAKDLLVSLRPFAEPPIRTTIDGYLADWYTGGYYEARAPVGRWTGAQVMRLLGGAVGPKMISAANAVIGAPAQDGKRVRVGDELLLGLAVTGDAEAVAYVLDMVDLEHPDLTLPERALGALHRAYLEPPGELFERADPAALVPHVDRLSRIAQGQRSNAMVNDAVALLGAAGPPHCLAPLIAMIDRPHDDPRYAWVGANHALRCGGPDAITAVARALPPGGSYEHEAMDGAVVGEIARMTPPAQVAAAARELLAERSWVARWVGVEVLGKVGTAEDAAALEALGRDRSKLHGYWGDQARPRGERKAEPTLGGRAVEVARRLRDGS